MEEDTEPMEWGDMDPAFKRLLESTPAMLEAYKTLNNPKQMAKLDAATGSFQAGINVEVPESSPIVTIPDSVSADIIKAVIQHYRETSVQPSTDLLSKHIREEVSNPQIGKEHALAVPRTSDLDLLGSRTTAKISHSLQCPSFHEHVQHHSEHELSP